MESPNDRKLSDGRGWRGPCMAGGKAAAEARAVTATPVRCSAWLGVASAAGQMSDCCDKSFPSVFSLFSLVSRADFKIGRKSDRAWLAVPLINDSHTIYRVE